MPRAINCTVCNVRGLRQCYRETRRRADCPCVANHVELCVCPEVFESCLGETSLLFGASHKKLTATLFRDSNSQYKKSQIPVIKFSLCLGDLTLFLLKIFKHDIFKNLLVIKAVEFTT